MTLYYDMKTMTGEKAMELAHELRTSWPFTRLSQEQTRLAEQADKLIKQKELHDNESPL